MILLNQLSQLGMGTSKAGSLGSRMSIRQFSEFLAIASANQLNLIDTADAYGSGDAERLIRTCIGSRAASFFVITKAGLPYVHTPGWLSPLNQIAKKVKQKAGGKTNFSAAYLIRSLQKSNTRLGVDAADAFLLHEPDWDALSGTDAWEGLSSIRKQGLARYTGVSTNDIRVIEDGIGRGQVQLVQTSVNWNDRRADAILTLCQRHAIPVIANQVLQPYQSLIPAFNRQADTIRALDGLAGISLVQLLIAAALGGRNVHSVLFGTRSAVHLQHNITSLHYTAGVARNLPAIQQLLA
jgi:pyridoxine 4-dehydrogenase